MSSIHSYGKVEEPLGEENEVKQLLRGFYGIHIKRVVRIDQREAYGDDEYIYVITSAHNNKAIHMEQATIAYYLLAQHPHVAHPIPNQKGEWLTEAGEQFYLVLRITQQQDHPPGQHGEALALFHERNIAYPYEPNEISNYGQWKQLWITKLTSFEDYIVQVAEEERNAFFRLLRDILPYLIGLSENAIQYVQESNAERDFNEADQGTIVFHRYEDQLEREVIWANDLLFDHRMRDVAEAIRQQILTDQSSQAIYEFLEAYETVLPLSSFSRRLLYARLLFPVHFYDLIGEAFTAQSYEASREGLEDLLARQETYEQVMKELFQQTETIGEKSQIPLIGWLT